MPETGDELVYRVREYSPSERVRVVEVDRRKKTPQYVVEFLGGDKSGVHENVPGGRLRAPWDDAVANDALMANCERINQAQLTDIEDSAVASVFEMLIPKEFAEWDWSPMRYATRIYDKRALQAL